MSFSFGSSSSKTNSSSKADPWGPAIPQLDSFLKDLPGTKQLIGPTGDQLDAFAQLKQKAAGGNPWAGQIDDLTADLFGGTGSRSGQVGGVYDQLQERLGGIASGKNLDPSTNPYIKQMMDTVGNDIQDRISRMWAGSGREITGNLGGQTALARGISSGTAPILAQFFGDEQNRMIDAAKALHGAGTSAAGQQQDMDTKALAGRAAGIDASTAALGARDHAQNTILNLDQQLKQMPFEDLSLYASLLLPIAGLGGQQKGNSSTKGSSSGFGMNLLSDERLKENVERVGEADNGLPIYRYSYKGDPTVHIGFLAQEVEEVMPEAVGEFGGYKTVNYSLATELGDA